MAFSDRTKKYVEALIRDRDFDYGKWLQEVKEAEKTSAGNVRASSNNETAPSQAGTVVQPVAQGVPAASVDSCRHSKLIKSVDAQKGSIAQCLEAAADVFEEVQDNRRRDAIYDYLDSIYKLVRTYQRKKRIRKLIRQAGAYSGLPIESATEPFAFVIRCTADVEIVDAKCRSKWSRALRYAARFKRRESLKAFMRRRGGINGCADRFAARLGSR